MKLLCAKCGSSYAAGDLFCRKCGTRVASASGSLEGCDSFEMEVMVLLESLRTFRVWVDQKRTKNVRFMQEYKERMEKGIQLSIRQFDERHRGREEGRSPVFHHTMEAFSALSRPIAFMETRLRPSVGMGVFLERWMMAQAVESYLKECCQEADHHLEEIAKELRPRSGDGGQML